MRRLCGVVVGLACALGCATEPRPAEVTVTPSLDTVEVSKIVTFVAHARDEHGLDMMGWTGQWTSSFPGVATVRDTGTSTIATGAAAGSTTITVNVAGVEATAALLVVPALPPVSGSWSGSILDITLTTSEDAAGNFVGSGRIADPNITGNTLALTVSGTRTIRIIHMVLAVPGYQQFVFDGTYSQDFRLLSGRLNASGFTNTPITFTRTTPVP